MIRAFCDKRVYTMEKVRDRDRTLTHALLSPRCQITPFISSRYRTSSNINNRHVACRRLRMTGPKDRCSSVNPFRYASIMEAFPARLQTS